ncbi:uncharacterized protein VP01_300g4 [Puccinia sorghi]|uniref:Dolichyl-diphosphooligosaccharide--protein glycosyltransferase subunit WBP1 n=1 Tax=Puccinia sorghi TaxID=27349 RepID=A0A0L6V222_9BASI|nr:uncharacterized protein VP01_300g4 [Puccinia sorghi]
MILPTLLLLTLLLAINPSSAGKILIIIEEDPQRAKYQSLWSSLTARHHQLTFRTPKDPTPVLTDFGERAFDHLILFAPTTKCIFPCRSFPTGIGPVPPRWREFDVDFDDRNTAVMDHFHNHQQDPLTIQTSNQLNNPLIEDQCRPTKHRIRSQPIHHGIDFFSDQFINAEVSLPDGKKTVSGNRKVIDHLTKWVFQESGVLRILSATHSKVDGGEQEPSRYQVNDEIEYKVDVQMLQNGRWGPSPMKDLQLEFSMLDPHLRVTLTPQKSGKGTHTTYRAVFRAPDRHGVFTFKLDYRRRTGYSHLEHKIQVALTPLDHDQYPRFLVPAFPYYAGSLSVVACFLLFSFIWLTHFPGSTLHKKNK